MDFFEALGVLEAIGNASGRAGSQTSPAGSWQLFSQVWLNRKTFDYGSETTTESVLLYLLVVAGALAAVLAAALAAALAVAPAPGCCSGCCSG